MQKFGVCVFLAAVFAILSAAMGLFIRLGSTWDAGWRAAGGCFAFCLLMLAIRALPRDSAWFRWSGRALWFGAAIGGYLLAAGVAGQPYERLGIVALIYCATDAWHRYRRTDHYRAHNDTPFTRLLAWIVTFEDPDRPQVQIRAGKSADDVERAGESRYPRD